MIKLVTPQGNLDLPPDIQIEWIITNPFFEERDVFVPQLTLPFYLPLTPNNQQKFQYAEQLQVSDYSISVEVTMYVQEVIFFRGRLNILQPGSSGYQCSLGYDRKKINTKKSIRTFEYGGARANTTDAAERAAINTKTYPEVDFVYPQIWNVKGSENAAFNGGGEILINDYSFGGGSYVNLELITPTAFLAYVMKQIFIEMDGIDVNGSFWDIPDIKRKVIYNPVVANDMVGESLELFLEYDFNIHSRATSGRHLKVGITNASSSTVAAGAKIFIVLDELTSGSYTVAAQHILTYTVVSGDVGHPDVMLQNIWAAIQALSVSFTLVNQDWSNPDNPFFVFAEARFKNTTNSANIVNGSLLRFYAQYQPNGAYTYNDILIAKHLPDISVSDFVNSIKDGFNLFIFYNSVSNTITFTPRQQLLLTQEYKDYTAQLLDGHIKETVETPIFKFIFEDDASDDEPFPENQWVANSPGYDSPDAVEMRIKLGFVKRHNLRNNFSLGTGEMARVAQTLNKYSDSDENLTPFTLRLMHWWGLTNDSVSVPYPKADDYYITPDQLYALHFSDWYKATRLGRELPEFKIMLTLQDIISFNPELKWKIRHNNYIFKQIRIPITHQGLQASTVKVMRIASNANVFNTSNGEAPE